MKIYPHDYQLEDKDTGGVGNSDDRTLKDFRKLPYPLNAYEFIYQYHSSELHRDDIVWDDNDRTATLEKLTDFIYDWVLPYTKVLTKWMTDPEKMRREIAFFIDVFKSKRTFRYLCRKYFKFGCDYATGIKTLNNTRRMLRLVFSTDTLLMHGLSAYNTKMVDILTNANLPMDTFIGKKSGILMPLHEPKINKEYGLVYKDNEERVDQDFTVIPIKCIRHGENLYATTLPDGMVTGYKLNTMIQIKSVFELLSIRPDQAKLIGCLSSDERHEMLVDLNNRLQIEVSYPTDRVWGVEPQTSWKFRGREIIPRAYDNDICNAVRLDLSRTLISSIGLTPRPANALERCGIKTIADIMTVKPNAIANIRGIGVGSYVNICNALKKFKIVPSDDGEVWIDEMIL